MKGGGLAYITRCCPPLVVMLYIKGGGLAYITRCCSPLVVMLCMKGGGLAYITRQGCPPLVIMLYIKGGGLAYITRCCPPLVVMLCMKGGGLAYITVCCPPLRVDDMMQRGRLAHDAGTISMAPGLDGHALPNRAPLPSCTPFSIYALASPHFSSCASSVLHTLLNICPCRPSLLIVRLFRLAHPSQYMPL